MQKMLLECLRNKKKRPHRYRGISRAVALRYLRERPTQARKRLGSELQAYVIVVQKRQWSHAGTSLGTGGGAFFLFLKHSSSIFCMGVVIY
jgi:hypothetical protein